LVKKSHQQRICYGRGPVRRRHGRSTCRWSSPRSSGRRPNPASGCLVTRCRELQPLHPGGRRGRDVAHRPAPAGRATPRRAFQAGDLGGRPAQTSC